MACMLQHPPLSEATTVRCRRRPPRGSLELSGQPLLLLLASHATLIMLQEIIQLALAQAAEES